MGGSSTRGSDGAQWPGLTLGVSRAARALRRRGSRAWALPRGHSGHAAPLSTATCVEVKGVGAWLGLGLRLGLGLGLGIGIGLGLEVKGVGAV